MRLAGGATGVGVLSVGLLPSAAASPGITLSLGSSVVDLDLDEVLSLHLGVDLRQVHRVFVFDTTGLTWTTVSSDRFGAQVWTAVPSQPGWGHVVVLSIRPDGRRGYDGLDFQIIGTATDMAGGGALIGMSAPSDQWDAKVAQVGPGLGARRIFADLADGPTSQMRLVEAAHAEGLLPVISYKVGGDVSGAINGAFDDDAEQAAAKLASYGLPTAVTFWHEPYGDMSGAAYASMHKRLMPIFKRGELRVGPILNGWLLDNKVAEFESFCPDELFEIWDFFGIDTYESGTMSNPGPSQPAHRISALSTYLKSRGYDLPIGVGEYNGYTAEAIAEGGEALLSTPNVWFGCMWNANGPGGAGVELSGDRLAAFRATLADPRAGSAQG